MCDLQSHELVKTFPLSFRSEIIQTNIDNLQGSREEGEITHNFKDAVFKLFH